MSIDIPRAWEIARSVSPEYHHNACSFNVTNGGVLCDCDVIYKHAEYLDKANFYGKDGAVLQPTQPTPCKGYCLTRSGNRTTDQIQCADCGRPKP